MTGLELILAALAAGVGGGITDATSTGIRDAYTGLRDLLRRKLASHDGQAVEVLDAEGTEPGVFEAQLREYLVGSGADRDDQILTSARQLLTLLDPSGEQTAKYTVDAREAKGTQIGDHNTQTNTFS
ncbi:hypothetical protein ACIBO9_28495 [Streptomyces prunicolor]|uniref:hypothetical protein n=1 Tax=Streptomyces prunicolor TaxID=67348 RepID=UPI0037D84C08